MSENPIIADIHRSREKLAQACDYDARKLMEHYRQRESERPDSGQRVVSYVEPPLGIILRQNEHQKGRQEGLLEARQADILEALESRFGPLPTELSQRIEASQDESALRLALRSAFMAASLEDFLRSSDLGS